MRARLGTTLSARLGAGLLAAAVALAPSASYAQTAAPSRSPNALQPVAAPGQAAPTVATPLTPDELKVLTHLEKIGARYGLAGEEHDRRQRTLLKREYDQRLSALERRYAKELESASKDYRQRHLDAMRELEAFLAKYPNDAKWTPDAMFRLAELYLDQAGMEWEENQLLAQASGVEPPPQDPDVDPGYTGPDYARAINLWKDLLTRFPDYRQADGTLYLLGYYLGEMGQVQAAKQVFLGLVCSNKFDPMAPPPPEPTPGAPVAIPLPSATPPVYNGYDDCTPRKEGSIVEDEAWVRIGEAHFDARNELAQAIAAYKRVVRHEEAELFDEALYKLAWSFYRNDQFMDGIAAFDRLVVYSDKKEEEGGGSVELRQEAVDYIAISFADPWEKNSQPDPAKSMERATAYYKGREKEKHVRDVFEKLGDTLRAGEAYDQSIAAWRVALVNFPLHPRNPLVHQKIVDALGDKGDAQAAMDERAKLAVAYKKGTEWYSANETNREAMDYSLRLGEQSLIAAAKSTHRNAQLAKADWEKKKTADGKEIYTGLYKEASILYQQYLVEFPSSSEVYELTYRLADTLYFSEQYIESVPHYRWVRDHRDLGTKYHEPAALSVVQAYQAEVDQRKAAGQLSEPAQPTVEGLKTSQTAIPVPDLFRDLQRAYDEYMTIIADRNTAPKMALASAMISYKHVQLDDALVRFQVVMKKFCGTPEATQAKEGQFAIYASREQLDKAQEVLTAFAASKCGTAEDIALAADQLGGIEYEVAKKLFKDGKFSEAADAFYKLYKTAPAKDKNRDDALFSSAIAAEKAGKPKTAIWLYGEFTRVAEFKDSEYFAEAMYRTAVSYQNAFDYDTAVDTYFRVVALAQEKGRKSRVEFDLQQARLDSMWNAAILREQDRVYKDRNKNDPGAITLYQRYARSDQKDKKRASEGYFRSALVYEKAGDSAAMRKTFAEWRKDFSTAPGAGALNVLSYYKTAKAYEKANDKKSAEQAYRDTIRAYDGSGEKPGTPSAELAGEGAFLLADKEYKADFEPYKVKWLGSMKDEKTAQKTVASTLDALKKIGERISKGYVDVARFESSWSLAAIVRLGDISFFAGDKLMSAPIPKEIEKLDKQFPDQNVLGQYQDGLLDQTKPQTEAAKNFWLQALETAKQKGVANEWSKLAARRLNAYIAADLYPVQRDEIIQREIVP